MRNQTMPKTLFGLLSMEAKPSFTNKNDPEYLKIKHFNMRTYVRVLRNCLNNKGWAKSGRGGWSIHDTKGSSMSGYHWQKTGNKVQDTPLLQAVLRLGIPLISTHSIPDEKIYEVVNFPMIGFECDDPPYHAFSYAPLEYVAKLYQDLGAIIYNLEV